LNKDWIPERGARIARRDDREYREYLREEQRTEAGCPARKPVLDQRGQSTRFETVMEIAGEEGRRWLAAFDFRDGLKAVPYRIR
jgi:hypothetical protein